MCVSVFMHVNAVLPNIADTRPKQLFQKQQDLVETNRCSLQLPDNLKVSIDGHLPQREATGEQRGALTHRKTKPKVAGLILKYTHHRENQVI